jgi:hypothetical protein
MTSLPEQISNRAIFFRVDISLRENAKSQHLGQPKGVMLIVRILESGVFLDLHGICKMHLVALFHQDID